MSRWISGCCKFFISFEYNLQKALASGWDNIDLTFLSCQPKTMKTLAKQCIINKLYEIRTNSKDEILGVLDLGSQVRNIVLMNAHLDLGNLGGWDLDEGVYEQGKGNEEFSTRATWVRGGRILSHQGGFQVSRGRQTGSKGEWKKGKAKKQGDHSVNAVS